MENKFLYLSYEHNLKYLIFFVCMIVKYQICLKPNWDFLINWFVLKLKLKLCDSDLNSIFFTFFRAKERNFINFSKKVRSFDVKKWFSNRKSFNWKRFKSFSSYNKNLFMVASQDLKHTKDSPKDSSSFLGID